MKLQAGYRKPLVGLTSIVLLGWMILQVGPPPLPRETTSARLVAEAYDKLPASFEPNLGQADPHVKFLCRGSRHGVFLSSSEAVLSFGKPAAGSTLRMKLVHANPNPEVEGLDPLPGRSNYFIGSDPERWRTNVPNYARVRYRAVYPGVDLIFYGGRKQLEYDFVVSAGADLGAIRLAFEGAKNIRLDPTGDLVLHTVAGDVVQCKPLFWQDLRGEQREIAGNYVLSGGNEVGFEVRGHDASAPLVIDPLLVYSTYLSGSGAEGAAGIAVDSAGNAYVTGTTASPNFPTTPGAFQSTANVIQTRGVAFITKLNPGGTALVYSTYLGGSGGEDGVGIAVDSAGNAYVTGFTLSTNFPITPGALQAAPGGRGDIFVTKLNVAGAALVYSTYLGGSGVENRSHIAVDSGNAYVTGFTLSTNFPTTPGAFQTAFGSGQNHAFVSKINATGTALIYSTLLGGSQNDYGNAIAVDSAGNAYVTGLPGPNFPTTPGAFQTTCCGAFVSKLNATGTALVYSTYLGESGREEGDGIAVDPAGNAYIIGGTFSTDFPTTPGAPQRAPGGGGDAFIAKLNAAGTMLLYSTYLGGSGLDAGESIAVDAAGNVWVTGLTESVNFPTTSDAFQTATGGGRDAFVAKLSAAGTTLVYSTYLGGSDFFRQFNPGGDMGHAIALDSAGNAYVTGETYSPDFPTTAGAFQINYPRAAFVAKFAQQGVVPAAPSFKAAGAVNAASFLPGRVVPGEIITIFGAGFGPATLATLHLNTAGRVDTVLADTRVLFDNVPAPLIYVVAGQLSAIIPYDLPFPLYTKVQIEYKGTPSGHVTLQLAPDASPGIFTVDSSGKGQGAILNQDSSVNSAGNPASIGSIVSIYATGEGQTNPPGVDGSLATSVLPKPLAPAGLKIGGITAEVQYAGAAPGLVAGVLQVNAKVPAGVTPGNAVPVSLTVGTATSQDGVTMSIRP